MRVSCRRAPPFSLPGGPASATGRPRRAAATGGATGEPPWPEAATRTRTAVARIAMHARRAHFVIAAPLIAPPLLAPPLIAPPSLPHPHCRTPYGPTLPARPPPPLAGPAQS